MVTEREEVQKIKGALAAYFEDQARWRERKAEEYPDDERNEVSAAGLRELAAFMLALPNDDPRLQRLIEFRYGAMIDSVEAVGIERDSCVGPMPDSAARFRFYTGPLGDQSVDGFFTQYTSVTRLCEIAEEETNMSGEEMPCPLHGSHGGRGEPDVDRTPWLTEGRPATAEEALAFSERDNPEWDGDPDVPWEAAHAEGCGCSDTERMSGHCPNS